MALDDHPMWRTIELTYIDVVSSYCPADRALELWLNPADWEALGRPGQYADAPVKRSAGIPAGTARFFDRQMLRYLPEVRPGPRPPS